MAQALAGVTRSPDREPRQKSEERVGSPDGSAAGTAATAEEGDAYFTAVQNAILAQYVLPSIISERERMSLQATVVAWIGGDGSILRHRFERRSGNRFFDDALELAIKRAKVPPPPAGRAREIREEGVALVFTP
jgi:outer membrane biosynthesis protein TonB